MPDEISEPNIAKQNEAMYRELRQIHTEEKFVEWMEQYVPRYYEDVYKALKRSQGDSFNWREIKDTLDVGNQESTAASGD